MPFKGGGYAWTAQKRFILSGAGSPDWIEDMDEICVGVNSDNKVVFATKLPKHQSYWKKNGDHTNSFVDGNSLYVLYQDAPENAKVTDNVHIKPFKNGYPNLMLAKVDSDGKYIKEELMPAGASAQAFCPANLEKIVDGTYFVPTVQGNQSYLQFMKVVLTP